MTRLITNLQHIIKSTLIDKLGICLSVTCGIHCIASIVFLALGALELHLSLEIELLEKTLTAIIFIIGLLAFLPSLLNQRRYMLTACFITGFLLLKISEGMTFSLRLPMLIMATILLILPHLINIRLKIRSAATLKKG